MEESMQGERTPATFLPIVRAVGRPFTRQGKESPPERLGLDVPELIVPRNIYLQAVSTPRADPDHRANVGKLEVHKTTNAQAGALQTRCGQNLASDQDPVSRGSKYFGTVLADCESQ
jgi:hypothetical protein